MWHCALGSHRENPVEKLVSGAFRVMRSGIYQLSGSTNGGEEARERVREDWQDDWQKDGGGDMSGRKARAANERHVHGMRQLPPLLAYGYFPVRKIHSGLTKISKGEK